MAHPTHSATSTRPLWPAVRAVLFALILCGCRLPAAPSLESAISFFGTYQFQLGGTVTGLRGRGLTLSNNGTPFSIETNGVFTAPGRFAEGAAYNVQVQTQPSVPGQTCTASNNTGTLHGDYAGVQVICSTGTHTVGGTVTGLLGTGLTLSINGGDVLPIAANGGFTFPTPLSDGSAYNVQVQTQPAGPNQACTASNNTGTVNGADITSVTVVCSAAVYTIGGNVTGLAGNSIILQLNGGSDLALSADGGFTFGTALADGSAYTVTVRDDADTRDCTLTGATGTLAGASISNVFVTCAADTTPPQLSASNPAGAQTGVDPVPARLLLTFNEEMDTAVAPTVAFAVWDGSTWVAAPATATMIWLDRFRLQIDASWIRFPENARIQWTLNTNLRDTAGNAIAVGPSKDLETTVRGHVLRVVDTGQTSCFYYAPGWTGDPGCGGVTYSVGSTTNPYGQDAHYSWRPQGYTGPTAHGTYASDFATTDNVTGLIWKSCLEGKSGAGCAGTATTFTWYGALDACSSLNNANANAGYWGIKTWRLPTYIELASLANYQSMTPSINTIGFPGMDAAFVTWTATALSPTSARYVDFSNSVLSSQVRAAGNLFVRCVSDPMPQNPRAFADNGDGTISDNSTGLMWQACSNGQTWSPGACTGAATAISWVSALAYCEGLSTGTPVQSDWRLPSHNELLSLLDLGRAGPPYIDADFFPGTMDSYWSSTTVMAGIGSARSIFFGSGSNAPADKSSDSLDVRCVRTLP